MGGFGTLTSQIRCFLKKAVRGDIRLQSPILLTLTFPEIRSEREHGSILSSHVLPDACLVQDRSVCLHICDGCSNHTLYRMERKE
jgi:hypothetical protein